MRPQRQSPGGAKDRRTDRLFDRGLITIGDAHTVQLSPAVQSVPVRRDNPTL
jgi:hypothetical protein